MKKNWFRKSEESIEELIDKIEKLSNVSIRNCIDVLAQTADALGEQTNIIFEWLRRCYEFEVSKGELKALNRESIAHKQYIGSRFKEEHAQWKKEHGVE